MKKNVAIYLLGVNLLRGGGGAERFFADFFELYSFYKYSKYNLYFFTDKETVNELNKVGKLEVYKSKIITLKVINNRFKKPLENIDFFLKLKKYKIDIIHCANYNRYDFNRMIFAKKNPLIKLILVQNIVDCRIPHILNDKNNSNYKSYYERYVSHLKLINFDGVFSWYKAYVEYFKKIDVINKKIIFKNIESRFANTDKFQPSKDKKKIIVFASRFDDQKKPSWFIEAVNILFKNQKFKISDWKFEMYGDGPLKKYLIKLIDKYALNDIINLKSHGKLEKVFPYTYCYVSTQDYENFPSLSMMEAMASGNIIVARDVGQTDLMVKDNINGFVLKKDSPEGLSDVLKQVITIREQTLKKMMGESIKLVKEVHSKKNFFLQIEDFWGNLTMIK